MDIHPFTGGASTVEKKSVALPMTLFVTLSYGNRIATLEDGAEKLYVSAAAFLSHHPSGANYFTVELMELKVMTKGLSDLFGLVLPEPSRKQAHKKTGDQLIPESQMSASSTGDRTC